MNFKAKFLKSGEFYVIFLVYTTTVRKQNKLILTKAHGLPGFCLPKFCFFAYVTCSWVDWTIGHIQSSDANILYNLSNLIL